MTDYPQRGQVWQVILDPVIGHEIGKTRPALVISNNINNQFADTVTVIPITSKTSKIYPFEVFISKNDSGLSADSKIKCNQVKTVDKSRLIKLTANVSQGIIEKTEEALLIHLGVTRESLI